MEIWKLALCLSGTHVFIQGCQSFQVHYRVIHVENGCRAPKKKEKKKYRAWLDSPILDSKQYNIALFYTSCVFPLVAAPFPFALGGPQRKKPKWLLLLA